MTSNFVEPSLLRFENLVKREAQIHIIEEEKRIFMTTDILQQCMKSRKVSYFGPKFSGCSKFKEKSHDVIMSLLGSKEQGSCT